MKRAKWFVGAWACLMAVCALGGWFFSVGVVEQSSWRVFATLGAYMTLMALGFVCLSKGVNQ